MNFVMVLSMLVFKSLLVSVCILCEINECFRCLMLILPGPVVDFIVCIYYSVCLVNRRILKI